jgi:amino acid transporter
VTPREAGSLSLVDGISVVVGIVVGVSVYKAPGLVFEATGDPWSGLGMWLAGGALSFIGALCYAELAATYPRSGGDYVYLTRAYGPAAGFLFGWAQLVAVLTGSIGAMAYVYADYAQALFGGASVVHAVCVILALSGVNAIGLRWGRGTQNALNAVKILGLAALLLAGWIALPGPAPAELTPARGGSYGFALILVLYAFGGWNDASYVASEVADPQRNVPRVLLLGTAGITLLYLLVNLSYLAGLGFDGARASAAPAADLLARAFGPWGGRVMSGLVMISALGAIQGLIFTGSRVYAAVGADHRAFRAIGKWSDVRGVPLRALLAQAGIAVGLVALVGTGAGRSLLDAALSAAGGGVLPWDRFGGGFDTLVAATAPVFWVFFLMTGAAVPLLRSRDPSRARPFRVPLYPLPPLVFCASCLFMLASSVEYAGWLTLVGLIPLALGVPVYAWSRARGG